MRSVVRLCLLCALVAPATARPTVTPAERAAANAAFQRADWPAAAKAYQALLAVEDHPAQHGRYGMALVELGKPRDAIAHLERSLATIPNPRVAFYLARARARLGETEAAFAALDQLVSAGGVAVATLRGERDFAAIATTRRFQDVLARDLAAVEPCRAAPEFRQFDFWLGEWTVTDPKGNFAGTSSVQLILGSCTVFENWTGSASSGKSFNIYDATDKRWHQTWVDDRGTFTHYIGGMSNGQMVVVANTIANAKPTLARMTFSRLANGDVRQFGESSTDAGKTWTTTFDLVYARRT